VAPPRSRYGEVPRRQAYFDAVLEAARRVPGAETAGGAWAVPFADGGLASGKIVIEGQPTPVGEEPTVGMYPVAGDYFGAMRIPLRGGRVFGPEDRADSPPVAVVSEAMARRHWPGEDAVGKRFKTGGADEVDEEEWVTVVGVVGSARRFSLDEEEQVETYFPLAQSAWASEMYVVIRTEADPLALAGSLRAELRAIDAEVPLSSVSTLAERVSKSVAQPRFRAFLVTCFAALACVLALVGIYGVMAFAVAQRRHEIGVRMALGARRAQVLGEVLRQGGGLISAGVVFGVVGALAASRSLTSMLFSVSPLDASTYAAVAALIAVAGLVACYVPARRASRVDPMVALRED
jgi:putative ABC transport system permease protein